MRVRLQSGGIMHPPEDKAGVDSTVIYTDDGSPIAVAVSIEGAVWVKTVSDPSFTSVMESLGFSKRDVPAVNTLKV